MLKYSLIITNNFFLHLNNIHNFAKLKHWLAQK